MAYYYNKKQARLNAISRAYSTKKFEMRMNLIRELGLNEELEKYKREHKGITTHRAVYYFCRKKGIN